MEQKLNITEILKNKALGTKLWSSLFGDVYFDSASANLVTVSHHKALAKFWRNAKLYDYDEAEPTLFPSKKMRDWSKFAWKKGDVLIRTNSEYCIGIFDEWTSDDYSTFSAKYINLGLSDNFSCSYTCNTKEWEKTENSKNYISEIERVMNGKLNLQTLEIQTQSEFKDGDIVCISGMGYLAYSIVKSIDNSSKKLEYYVLNDMSTLKFEDWLSFEDKQIQPIADTQQIILFDALARENKAWDVEKKQIVDLKPKVELKPFDKVIVRCSKADKWSIDFFSYKVSNGYICTGDAWFGYCLPYNEETAKLVGTTNNVEDQV
jgi:hypothetical protein